MILSRAGEIMHRFMLQLNEWRNFSTKLTHEGMKAFELLGISSSSTPDECKKAYLNLACSIHPYVKNDSIDSNDNNDLQKKANIEFHRLHQAYTLAYKICANNHQLSRNDCLLKQLDYDIREFRNKAPHHRRFLDLERQEHHLNRFHQPIKNGNLNERRKSLQSQRITKAQHRAANYRVEKIMESVNHDDDSQGDYNKLMQRRPSVKENNADIYTDFETEVKEFNLIVPSPEMQRFHLDSKTAIDQLTRKEHSQIDEESKQIDHATTEDQNKNDTPKSEDDNQSLWDPRYMAEVMHDFYRELAKSFVSILRGFKDHK